MARIRSPNYPSIGLPEAIERVGRIYKHEQHLAAPREVVAQHMGYGGINGSSIKALSALLKYGLLEKTKDDKRKVSALALKILHPRDEDEKNGAIQEAASRPALFVEIAKEWPDGNPSDPNLKAYLLGRLFSMDAIPEVIKAYRDTVALVAPLGAIYKEAETPSDEKKQSPMQQQATRQPRTPKSQPQVVVAVDEESRDPFKVTFTGSGIEIVGRIATERDADSLVSAVNALKLLLQSPTKVERPQNLDDPSMQDEG
jgi:hypothetical protein